MTSKIRSIGPAEASRMMTAGAALIDIRGMDEHARERIAGARNLPLAALGEIDHDGPVIFHCRTGHRTRLNAERLGQACRGEAFLLDGGIEGWKAAGLPIVADRRQPWEIMRQVQVIAGSLVILSVLLGLLVSPAFLALAGAVGGGMIHAGVTGSCAMARLLAPLPWNRRQAA